MDSMKESLILNAVCLLGALGFFAVAAYTVGTGQVMSMGVDGLFTTLVFLLLALIFAINPLLSLRNGSLRNLFKKKKSDQ